MAQYPMFSFTGQPQSNQSSQAGLQQYLTQGQMGINPGSVGVTASDPISAIASGQFGKSLQQAQQMMPMGTQMRRSPWGQQPSSFTPSPGNPGMGNQTGPSAGPGFIPAALNQMGMTQPGFDQAAGQQPQGGPSVQQMMLAQGLMSPQGQWTGGD